MLKANILDANGLLDLVFNADESNKHKSLREGITIEQLQRMYDQGYIN